MVMGKEFFLGCINHLLELQKRKSEEMGDNSDKEWNNIYLYNQSAINIEVMGWQMCDNAHNNMILLE